MDAERVHARPERTHTGEHDGIRGLDLDRVRREARIGTDVVERLLGRAQVADAVVEDCYPRHRVPLVDGTPMPSTFTASRNERATPLKVASMMWCVFLPRTRVTCSVIADAVDEGTPELLDQLRVERRVTEDLLAGEVDLVVQVRTTGKIERHVDERFVERHVVRREATHARLVTERLGEHLAEHDADVLDGVVRVDLEIAPRRDEQIEAAVAAELAQHVVEERDAGDDVDVTGAVEG